MKLGGCKIRGHWGGLGMVGVRLKQGCAMGGTQEWGAAMGGPTGGPQEIFRRGGWNWGVMRGHPAMDGEGALWQWELQ